MKFALNNFQIHKSTVCDIPEGETTYIEGDSDTGKSSKLRALRWLCTNKPDGGSFVTFKTPRGATSKVELSEIDGHTVTRERGKSKNLYTLDGEVYEAFGRQVPEPVAKVLRLSPYAFQLQGEPPFLIGFTPTDAAKVLSEACGLGVIDTAVAFVRSKKAEADADLRKTEILLESAQQRLAAAEAQMPLADALEAAAGAGEACEALERRRGLLEGAIEAEPQGTVLDIEPLRDCCCLAHQAETAMLNAISRADAVRLAVNAAPQGVLFKLEGVDFAVENARLLDAEHACLVARISDVITALRDEPRGTPIDTTELQQQRAQIKVCPMCGREL